MTLKIVFAGGGTGGHFYPALNIARVFEKEAQCDITFFGIKKGIEAKKVPPLGYKLVLLNVSGFHRRLTIDNLFFPFRLAGSLVKSFYYLKKINPDVVIGTGGYVMGPVLRIAALLKIPLFIQEQNSYPGVTTRLSAKYAKHIFLAYEEAKRFLPEKVPTTISGNPLFMPQKRIDKMSAREKWKINENSKVVFVFGGSQGALSLNKMMMEILEKNMLQVEKAVLIWQTGERNYKHISNWIRDKVNKINIFIMPFIDDMWTVYSLSDLAVCRSGAMSLSELAASNLPAVLIPLSSAAGDHQFKNARAFEEKGAAFVVRESEAKAIKVAEKINMFFNKPELAKDMRNNMAKLSKTDSANTIVATIKNYMD